VYGVSVGCVNIYSAFPAYIRAITIQLILVRVFSEFINKHNFL